MSTLFALYISANETMFEADCIFSFACRSLDQPENAIPIESWFDDPDDDELHQLIPILDALAKVSTEREHAND